MKSKLYIIPRVTGYRLYHIDKCLFTIHSNVIIVNDIKINLYIGDILCLSLFKNNSTYI